MLKKLLFMNNKDSSPSPQNPINETRPKPLQSSVVTLNQVCTLIAGCILESVQKLQFMPFLFFLWLSYRIPTPHYHSLRLAWPIFCAISNYVHLHTV